MGVIWTPGSTRTTQPQRNAEPSPAWIAKGLVALFLAGQDDYELVTNKALTEIYTDEDDRYFLQASRRGISRKFENFLSGQAQRPTVGIPIPELSSRSLSYFMVSGFGLASGAGVGARSTSGNIFLRRNSGSYSVRIGGTDYTGSTFTEDEGDSRTYLLRASSSALSLSVNGSSVISGSAPASASVTGPINLGFDVLLGGYMNLTTEMVAVFDKTLSDEDAAALHSNPYQIFKPRTRTIFLPALFQGSASVPVGGVAAAGATGQLTATGVANTTVSGVAAAGDVGAINVSTEGAVFVNTTGVSATGNPGALDISAAANSDLAGVGGTTAVGSLVVTTAGNASVPLTGVSATGATGSVDATGTATGTATVNLTGAAGAATAGTFAPQAAATVSLLSTSTEGNVGSTLVEGGAAVSLSGVTAPGAVSSLGVTIANSSATVYLTSVVSIGSVGPVLIWGEVPTFQDSTWLPVGDGQEVSWQLVQGD